MKKIRRESLEKLNFGIDLSEKKRRLPSKSMLLSMVTKRWKRFSSLSKRSKQKNSKKSKLFNQQKNLLKYI